MARTSAKYIGPFSINSLISMIQLRTRQYWKWLHNFLLAILTPCIVVKITQKLSINFCNFNFQILPALGQQLKCQYPVSQIPVEENLLRTARARGVVQVR
jgi:hypothetical protein